MKVFLALLVLCGVALAQDVDNAALRHLTGRDIDPVSGPHFVMVDGVKAVVGANVTLQNVRNHQSTQEFQAYWPTSPEYATWQSQMPFLSPELLIPRVRGTNVVGLSQLVQDADTGELEGVPWSGSPPHTGEEKWRDWQALRGSNAVLRAQIDATREQCRQALANLDTALNRLDQWRSGVSNALAMTKAVSTNSLTGATKTFGAALRRAQIEGLQADRDGIASVKNGLQATRDTVQGIKAIYDKGGK